MSLPSHVWEQLKGISVDELVRALERDGWMCDVTMGSIRIYRNASGGRVSIHYHPGKTFGSKLLHALLDDVGWTVEDMRRLKLVK
jgi:predicted RNA binding protein YcfA (HicA-like mRNA interferase family)